MWGFLKRLTGRNTKSKAKPDNNYRPHPYRAPKEDWDRYNEVGPARTNTSDDVANIAMNALMMATMLKEPETSPPPALEEEPTRRDTWVPDPSPSTPSSWDSSPSDTGYSSSD